MRPVDMKREGDTVSLTFENTLDPSQKAAVSANIMDIDFTWIYQSFDKINAKYPDAERFRSTCDKFVGRFI